MGESSDVGCTIDSTELSEINLSGNAYRSLLGLIGGRRLGVPVQVMYESLLCWCTVVRGERDVGNGRLVVNCDKVEGSLEIEIEYNNPPRVWGRVGGVFNSVEGFLLGVRALKF